jgi:hypothetical protein
MQLLSNTCGRSYPLLSSIFVVDAKNIILTKIRARLDLDEMQRYFSRVFETMHNTEWNMGRLVL